MAKQKIGSRYVPPEELEVIIERTMPLSTDFTVLILKGHLILEGQIDRLISRMCEQPDFLDDARLSFFQKYCLMFALIGQGPEDEEVWDKLRELNKIRNQLAHRLDIHDLDELVRAFVGTSKSEWRKWTLNEKAVELRVFMMGLCTYLIHFVDELFKESKLHQLFGKIETRIKEAEMKPEAAI